jgi:hypothetical protein
MLTYSFTGLLKMELPTRTVRLCDGGFFVWGAETYGATDAVFGSISALGDLREGVGDEVPALELTLSPPGQTLPADLVQPGFQNSRVRLWLAAYNPVTGLLVGSPVPQFDGQLDQCTFLVGRERKELQASVVSRLERLFQRNIGNSLNPTFHKSIWPGETGEDNATGLVRQVAWGVESPPGAANGSASGGPSFGGGGFGRNVADLL